LDEIIEYTYESRQDLKFQRQEGIFNLSDLIFWRKESSDRNWKNWENQATPFITKYRNNVALAFA
jgi:hypothetical protein